MNKARRNKSMTSGDRDKIVNGYIQQISAIDTAIIQLGYDYVSTRTWFAWYGNQAQTRAQASTIYETRDSGRTWTAITGRL